MLYVDHARIGDRLNWSGVVDAMRAGHLLPKAEISDQFVTRGNDTLLSRAAWIHGLGFGVKSVSVMSENVSKGLPTVQGAMLVFEDRDGCLEAVIDSPLITEWKTAGDSVFGAKLLARADAKNYLIIGAGVVAENLVRAYSEIFPNLERIQVWNRTTTKAEALANEMVQKGYPVEAVSDLPVACGEADIISTATMSHEPVLKGEWITPGTHVDLIGAFRADMREADDTLLQKSSLFVDSFDTTIEHIGELIMPLKSGAIERSDVLADYYDLVAGATGRQSSDEITILKNGGGAHLDVMTARYILSALDTK